MPQTVSNPSTIENAPSPDLRRDLVLPRQLAAELRMSVRTLQRLNDARTGPPRITLGKHIYYRRAAVEQWLARCEGYEAAPMRSRRKPVSRKSGVRTKTSRRQFA